MTVRVHAIRGILWHLAIWSCGIHLHGILDLLVLEAMRQEGIICFCNIVHRCRDAFLHGPASWKIEPLRHSTPMSRPDSIATQQYNQTIQELQEDLCADDKKLMLPMYTIATACAGCSGSHGLSDGVVTKTHRDGVSDPGFIVC